jgi:hypothetical protein
MCMGETLRRGRYLETFRVPADIYLSAVPLFLPCNAMFTGEVCDALNENRTTATSMYYIPTVCAFHRSIRQLG